MIDLCVVNYNTRPLLQRMLDVLHSDLDSVEKKWTLQIMDNESTDDFIPWLRDNEERYQIDRTYLRKNIGYSAAINYMASKTSSDIIAVLNGDIWMTSSDVYNIQQIFDSNPDIHILGPKQRDEKGFITHAGIIGTNTEPKHRAWKEPDPQDTAYRDRIECVTVSGAAYFIRREVWDALTNNEKYREIYPSTPKPGQGVSHADSYFPISREIFRKACDYIGIERD